MGAAVSEPARCCVSVEGDDFDMLLDKGEGPAKLGLDVNPRAEADALRINQICGGLAERWNSTYPELQVVAGDRIIAVNGCTGTAADLLRFCKEGRRLTLRIRRNATG
mmetsp:Transcript_95425/g.274855  ORF Transcript_95425/g.274855 Transcript_95425/m.274855 type:complete len:108 (+) Transcript_95425:140-463(+)